MSALPGSCLGMAMASAASASLSNSLFIPMRHSPSPSECGTSVLGRVNFWKTDFSVPDLKYIGKKNMFKKKSFFRPTVSSGRGFYILIPPNLTILKSKYCNHQNLVNFCLLYQGGILKVKNPMVGLKDFFFNMFFCLNFQNMGWNFATLDIDPPYSGPCPALTLPSPFPPAHLYRRFG